MASSYHHKVFVGGVPYGYSKFKFKSLLTKWLENKNCQISEPTKDNSAGCLTYQLLFENAYDAANFVQQEKHRQISFGGRCYQMTFSCDDPSLFLPMAVANHELQEMMLSEKLDREKIHFDDKLYTWTTLMNSRKGTLITAGTKCIIITNVDNNTKLDKLKLYFSNHKRSGGGEICSVITMVDGVLLQFCDRTLAELVANKQHTVDDRKLGVYSRTMPSLCLDMFVLKGVPEKCDADTLTIFLENCDKPYEREPLRVMKGDPPGCYLVSYRQGVDIVNIMRNVESESLEGSRLQTSRVARTNCIQLCGEALNTAGKEAIRMFMSNKSRSGGSNVTRVDRCASGLVLVYYAEFEVAEQVCERWRESKLKIPSKGQLIQVETSLYHHDVFTSHHNLVDDVAMTSPQLTSGDEQPPTVPDVLDRESNEVPRSFFFKPTTSQAVFSLFHENNRDVVAKLQDVATVEFTSDQPNTIRFFPRMDLEITHSVFEKTCKQAVDDFTEHFKSEHLTLDKKKCTQIREQQGWSKDNFSVRLPGCDFTAFIQWTKQGAIVTCEMSNMEQATETLKNLCQIEEKVIPMTKRKLRNLIETGCLDEVKEKHKGKIMLTSHEEHMVVKGPKNDLQNVEIEILMQLNALERKKVRGLDDCVLKVLINAFSASSDRPNLMRDHIRDEFSKRDIKAALQVEDDELYAYLRTTDQFNGLINCLKQLVSTRRIPVNDPDWKALISTKRWNEFCCQFAGSGSRDIGFYDNTIVISGLPSELNEVDVTSFLDENAIRKSRETIGGLRLKFLRLCDVRTKQKLGTLGSDWTIENEESGIIQFRGTRTQLAEKKRSLDAATKSYVISPAIGIYDPGVPEYFRSKKGKDFVQKTGEASMCVISVDTPRSLDETTPKPVHTAQAKAASAQVWATAVVKSGQQQGSTELKVVQFDIVQQQCDAIVNASNPELQLLPGGVSGVILQKGGKDIQIEMDKVRASRGGILLPGDAIITGSGCLKTCNHIIHAVGPRWNEEGASFSKSCNLLRACIFKSLELADAESAKSITIPAISCGIFGGKLDVCCPIIVEEIVKYCASNNNKNIKKVLLIEKDKQEVLKEFVKSIQTNNQVTTVQAASSDQSVPLSSTTDHQRKNSASGTVVKMPTNTTGSRNYGNISVSVYQGDITADRSEVIVNSTNSQFDLNQGMVSKAILQKGGQRRIQQDCQSNSHTLNSPQLRVTGGYKLPAKHICHICFGNDLNQMKSIVHHVLVTCDRLNATSVAIPALGTGNLGMSCTDIAKAMRSCFEDFNSQYRPNYLREINVVIFDNSMVSDFKREILNQQPAASTWSGFSNKIRKTLSEFLFGTKDTKDESASTERIDLQFCSNSQDNVDKAINLVKNHITEISKMNVIDDEVLERMSDADLADIALLERKHKVKIEDESNKYLKRFRIRGLSENVTAAKEDALDVIREFRQAEICAKYVTWIYVDPKTKSSVKFSARSIFILEENYQKNKAGKCEVKSANNCKIVVNFAVMRGTFCDSNTDTEVAREQKGSENLPSSWTRMTGNLHKEQLNPTSQEYRDVMKKFDSGGAFYSNVISLERVQNLSLYKQFVAKKSEVEGKFQKWNISNFPITRDLFHGTPYDVGDKILQQGFDRGFAGANATLYGKGVYFATDPAYSHRYATPCSQSDHRRMFLAEVVTGEFCVGNQQLVAPPQIKGRTKVDLYDSVADQSNSPSIFVVFKDASVYPLYMLTYK